mgnify:CR=1 FL=1
MILDGRQVESGTELEADVCVIGAGPAGIALAIELDAAGLRVCLVESGGTDLDRRADALNELVDNGSPSQPAISRSRSPPTSASSSMFA